MRLKYNLTIVFIIFSIGISRAQTKFPNICSDINTETHPFVCSDGSKMVFVSNKSSAWELYYCNNLGDDKWSEPKLIEFEGGLLGIGVELKTPSLSARGDVLYFSSQLQNTQGGKDIYYSQLKDGKWQAPVNISTINSLTDESAPMISADDNYMFFVRKHPGKKGGEFIHKIYYTKRDKNREWIDPIVVSDKINSSDENYPFLCEDNRILFFSSKRDKEPEGYNLYMSIMVAENVWMDPKPLVLLNTDFDDISPSKQANKNKLYYAQFLEKRKSIEGNIFTAKLAKSLLPHKVFEFEGTVVDDKTDAPLEATITVRYSDNMEKIGEQQTKMPNGHYQFYFTQGRAIEFKVSAKNYSYKFYEFDAGYNTQIPDTPIVKKVQLFNESILLLTVFDEEIFEPLEGKVELFNMNEENISSDKIAYKGKGRYEIKLEIGEKYKIKVFVKNYEEYSFEFDLTGVIQYSEFTKDVELTPSKTPFEISIADMETDEAIDEVEIIITNLEKNETIIKKVRKDANGKFIVDLRDGDKYEINVNGPKGYAFYNTKVDMASPESKKLEVKLKPLKAKTKLVLNDITFESNSAELNVSSFEELNRVVKLLIDNPDINIEIAAHTDDVGSNAYNEKLSGKRAQSVVDYLVNNKLPVERLIAKGYGETVPLVENSSDENRAKNRRVELKIVDINETN